MRFPKIRIKFVLFGLALAGLGFFLLKDFVFKEPAEVPLELGGAPAPHKKIVVRPVSRERPAVSRPAAPSKAAYMAIVLDDWGNNYSLVQHALEIKRPVTLSILPNLSQSKRIAEAAFKNRLGVMLHMPMQPESNKEPLEPHTILTTTPDEDIRRFLDEAMVSVPHAEGVNNHMGSAATRDSRVMKAVLRHLKKKGLFFVDSNVIPQTVGPRVARETGVPFTKRDVFIDNELDSRAIKRKLVEAKNIALRKGRVVVIGHDKKVTLRAIREMAPELEKEGIRFVLVKELAK